jgi:predicted lipoprotein
MRILKKITITLFTFAFLFSACGEDSENAPSQNCGGEFDQRAMFQNIAETIILPGYEDLKSSADQMAADAAGFRDNPNAEALFELQNSFIQAWHSWQKVAQLEFGPAEEVFLRSSLNNFPANIQQIEENIQSGSWDFGQPERYDKGFPALDYLLFGADDSRETIASLFNSNETWRNYLDALITDITDRVDHTLNGWKSEYLDIFTENTGSAAGTSLSLLINNLNEHYELIKRDKLGIPSGLLTLGFTNPENVEAYYSGQSVSLAKTALIAARRLYLGNGNGVEGLGLDDYLNAANAKKGEISLDQAIQNQFDAAEEALNQLADPLSERVEDDNSAVVNAYNEVTKNVVMLKTDMPSVLCVSITYIDNPSDSD